MKQRRMFTVILFSLLLVSSLVFLGCEVGNSDSAVREIGVDFTGFYDSTGTSNDFVSPANSGARVKSFNLRQNGDQLEAIDNNNIVFHGSVGDSSGSSGTGTSSFQLEGQTTAGQPVTISGTLSGANTSGNSATAIMDGTWIEPNIYAHILGDAVINPITTNSPSPTTNSLSVSASATSIKTTQSSTLTAQGGSQDYGNFTWSYSPSSLGGLTATSGQTTTFEANNSSTGTVTVMVNDVTGNESKSVTITIVQ